MNNEYILLLNVYIFCRFMTKEKDSKIETNKEKMMRCTLTLIKIQNEVGTKEKQFQEIGQFLCKAKQERYS